MIRIALFNLQSHPNPDYSNVADGLRARGHRVILGLLNEQGGLAWHDGAKVIAVQEFPRAEGRIPSVFEIRRSSLKWMQHIRQFLRELRPDVVQVDPGEMMFPWMLPLRMPRSIRFIFDVKQINLGVQGGATGLVKERLHLQIWKACALYLYDHACFDYQGAAEALLGPDWERSATVVPVGISPEFLKVSRKAEMEKNHNGCVRFVYAGHLSHFRETERLIRAVELLAARTKRFHVHFVGWDTTGGYLSGLVCRMGLRGLVTLSPAVPHEDMPELLAGEHVGLAYTPLRPTWHFQPTIKVKEYRAAGLPIIASDVRAHHDFVEDGVNGLLVTNKVEVWAQAMLNFIESENFLDHCWRNAVKMRSATTIAEAAEIQEKVYRNRLGIDHTNCKPLRESGSTFFKTEK